MCHTKTELRKEEAQLLQVQSAKLFLILPVTYKVDWFSVFSSWICEVSDTVKSASNLSKPYLKYYSSRSNVQPAFNLMVFSQSRNCPVPD